MLHVLSWTPEQRYSRLALIMLEEKASLPPPATLVAQAKWLWAHRLARLDSLRMLCLVPLIIGVSEGILRRATDQRGGFLLALWTIGVLGMGLTLLAAWSFLTLPYVLSPLYAPGVLGVLGGASLYALTAGRPAVA